MGRDWPQDVIDASMLDDDAHEGDDDWDELLCSMGRDGQCGQAGSEYCDFECPTMAAVRAEARQRAERKADR